MHARLCPVRYLIVILHMCWQYKSEPLVKLYLPDRQSWLAHIIATITGCIAIVSCEETIRAPQKKDYHLEISDAIMQY
jgi:hypothetical protein